MSDSADAHKARMRVGFDRIARDYDAGPGYFAHFGRQLVDLIGVQPGQRVLDIATGRGAILFPAIERVGAKGEVIGIDLSEAMVDATSEDVARRGLAAQIRVMDAERLDFLDASFDCVLCGFSMMFFPNPAWVLSEARRVLKPNGRLGVSTWHATQTDDLAVVLAQLGLSNPAADVKRFSDPDAVAQLLTDADFSAVQVQLDAAMFLYDSIDQYWQNARGTLMRGMIDSFAPDDIARVRTALAEHFLPRTSVDGIPVESVAVLAEATR